MAFLQLDNINLFFADRQILKDVQLTISPKSRIALTGANGSGKSTLMKVIAGQLEADSGRVIRPANVRVAYLPQSGIVHEGRSLREEVLEAFSELAALEQEAGGIAAELESTPENHEALLNRYQEIQETLEQAGWERREAAADRVLTGLGFGREEFGKDCSAFSGGWQMRIALAKILLESPDILLLDEPTNYLDLEAREWLRDFLARFPGGILLVSHDRSFLDASCTQVGELFLAGLKLYAGNYSAWEKTRKSELAQLMSQWKRQQEEIEKIERFIARFRYTSSRAPQVQSRIKMLEKMERIEIPPALKRIRFSFPPSPHSGKVVLRAENLGKNYGSKEVFSALSFELSRGSRTAVTGVNGAGKTTLLRIISGEDAGFEGELTLGSGVQRGYFSQNQEKVLDADLTVLEEAAKGCGEGEGYLRSLLGAFLFSGDDIHKKVGVLSGGERNRLALLKILLSPVNLLILDEPTNHLDIHSKDVLLEALQDFGGTLLIVSHDRYFLEKVSTNVLNISEGRGTVYPGSYAEYRRREKSREAGALSGSGKEAARRREAGPGNSNRPGNEAAQHGEAGPGNSNRPGNEAAQHGEAADKSREQRGNRPGNEAAQRGEAADKSRGNRPPENTPGPVRLSREEQKQRRSRINKLKNEEASLSRRLEEKEAKAAELRRELEKPENYSDAQKAHTLSAALMETEERIEQISAAWMECAEALEQAQAE